VIHSGIIAFLDLYHSVIDTGEFFFRGELTFVYKGFLFLCIAFLFFHFTGKNKRGIWMTVLGIAIALTVTRGFWFALFATYAVFYFSISKLRMLIFSFLAISVLLFGQIAISQTSRIIYAFGAQPDNSKIDSKKSVLLGDRLHSDEGRIQQVKEVVQQTTIISTLIGHGFGIGIKSRPVHMEISYLEIFHKQGLLGLAFWLLVFGQLILKYQGSKKDGFSQAFFLSGLLVFIQSLTNQYVNNPIGLSIVLLSIVCLDVSKKEDSCYNL
jgi:hypothetical protein